MKGRPYLIHAIVLDAKLATVAIRSLRTLLHQLLLDGCVFPGCLLAKSFHAEIQKQFVIQPILKYKTSKVNVPSSLNYHLYLIYD